MNPSGEQPEIGHPVALFLFWIAAAWICRCIDSPYADLASHIGIVLAAQQSLVFVTRLILRRQEKPAVEAAMIAKLYALLAFAGIVFVAVHFFGKMESFWTFLSLFGGLFLGLSLQTPISGFVAWILICLKRPFRPGDRILFPNLEELTGDVKSINSMYTVLDQVGGSVGSEEAVGRDVLLPNAMLFSQVVINYTTLREASYMLDEIVVRITYDSDWEAAEKILLDAAREITGDIIQTTGSLPYIRSDLYDYGVYMRLHYQTRVTERAETAYKINRKIFEEIQRIPTVDIAIPFIYSYRSAMDRREEPPEIPHVSNIREIEMGLIHVPPFEIDHKELRQLEVTISKHGLLQPIIVRENRAKWNYELLSGHMRYEACRRLGWSTITAIVRPRTAP